MERVEIVVDDVRISLLKGRDEDIVYIHCSGGDAELWKYQLEYVGGYAIDLPNHGKSDCIKINSIDDYAYFVAEVIKKLFDKAVVAGHSLGGAIAQKVYLNYREIVSGLILIGTGARLRVLPELLEGLEKNPSETAKMLAEMSFANREFVDSFARIFEERAKVLRNDLILCDKFDLLEQYRNGSIKIDVPTLIIVGEKDVLTPVKYSQFFHKHIPNSKLVVISDAGHMVIIEKPEEVNREIKEFIEKIR